MKGETLITSDGTTLLGADDKAGIAEILTAVETIQEKGLPHGKLCIAFTPDEEIGEGAELFDIPASVPTLPIRWTAAMPAPLSTRTSTPLPPP